jgi:hypothetical protein
MSRCGCSLPANASGFDPHRTSITSRFGQVPHLPNNYRNSTAPRAGPGSPQHYDCHDASHALVPAVSRGVSILESVHID